MGETAVCQPTPNQHPESDDVTVWDADRLVAVTVGQGGTNITVDIRPDAYTYLTPAMLSQTINETHAEAVTALRQATVAQFMNLCGVKLSPAEVANGRTRIHSLLDKLAGRTLH